jgi:predicted amidohydrolase
MKIRVAGAQIPVSKYIENNVKEIKLALDWAANNKVDILLTPEGALSGYMKSFDEIHKENISHYEKEVVLYAAERGVCLALGTLYPESKPFGIVKTSQIRYYNDWGHHVSTYEKQMVIPADQAYPGQGPVITRLEGIKETGRYDFTVGSFICNDLWGELNQRVVANENLQHYANNNVNLIFQSTNGFRSNVAGDDSSNYKLREYGNIHLWMASRYGIPIVTVDSCNTIDGEFHNGSTSSTSGVIYNGEWLVQARENATDYFYYDFDM